MVRRKQTVSKEHTDVLRQWKQRGFLAPDFEYEELTSHYMEQLNKAAKNLAGSIYEEHHKGEKVRIYRETTVMTNVSGYHADTPITIKAEPSIWPTAALINIHEHPI